MIISLTGTPGTGKTTIAENLKNKGFKVIDLTHFVKERGLGKDGENEFEVDIEKMKKRLEEEVDPDENIVIEGHLSHHFPSDFCIVLRCNPEELRQRLSERDYSKEKVEENVESEILDVVLSESVEQQEEIIEIDTSGRNPHKVSEEVSRKIEDGETSFGDIDWTEYI